jgi:hypothetical protein
VTSMGSKRKERERQFLGPEGLSPAFLSPDLAECALASLRSALEQRAGGKVHATCDNHYSPHCLGAIVLVVSAFDVWLNEALSLLDGWCGLPDTRPLATKPMCEKYVGLMARLGVERPRCTGDLRRAVDVRDEIVHYLPRSDVPAWFEDLERQGMFIATGRSSDFALPQKLPSYKLAYWVWEVVLTAIEEMLPAIPGGGRAVIEATAQNFRRAADLRPSAE